MHSNADKHWVVVPLGAIQGHLMHIVLVPKHITTPQAAHQWRTSAYRSDLPWHILAVHGTSGEWNLYEYDGKFRRSDHITIHEVPEPYREQLQALMALES